MNAAESKQVRFELNEVIELKELLFKVVLIDAGSGKLCLKQIDEREAAFLKSKKN